MLTALLTLGIGSTLASCSDEFRSCEETRTCEGTERDSGSDATTGSGGTNGTGGGGGQSGGAGGSGGVGTGGVNGIPPEECPTGFRDCNGDVMDACEAELATNIDHCGACNDPCSADGTTARACIDGECVPTCDATHEDCNDDGRDGCEVDVKADPDHCGACNEPCSDSGVATRRCIDGSCNPECGSDHASCDDDGRNGCETDIATDPDNCGACDFECSSTDVATRRCQDHACAPVCTETTGDCSTPARPAADDGCETDTTTALNCGACGKDCRGASCSSQRCGVVTLAANRDSVHKLTTDDRYIYWTERGESRRVMRTALAAVGTASMALMHAVANQGRPTGIAADGAYVFWGVEGDPTEIRRAPIGSTSSTTIASRADNPQLLSPNLLAVDGTNVYWTDGIRVFRLPRLAVLGDPFFELNPAYTGMEPTHLAVDESHVYFPEHYRYLNRVATSGGNESQIGDTDGAALALDDTHIYFTVWAPESEIVRVNKQNPSSTQTVAPNEISVTGGLYAMSIGGDVLYVAADRGVFSVPKTGGTLTLLSSASRATDLEYRNGLLVWLEDPGPLGGMVKRMVP